MTTNFKLVSLVPNNCGMAILRITLLYWLTKFFRSWLPMGGLFFLFFFCLEHPLHAQLTKYQVVEVIRDAGLNLSSSVMDRRGQAQGEYKLMLGRWDEYETSWRTGQAALALIEAYQITPNPQFMLKATKAGEFWQALRIIDGPELLGLIDATQREGIGDVLGFASISRGTEGMYALSQQTGDSAFASLATEAAGWLLRNTCDPETGICYDYIHPRTGLVVENRTPFDPQNVDPPASAVMRPHPEGRMWLSAFEFTQDSSYLRVFLAACSTLVATQGSKGLWMQVYPNQADQGRVHPTWNLWYAESLLDAYAVTRDTRFLAAARKTVDTYLSLQTSDGTIYYDSYLDGRLERRSISGSAVAMLGRLMIRLEEAGLEGYTPYVHRCARWIYDNRYDVAHPDPNLRGAVIELWSRMRRGKLDLINRDLGTIFGLRFMTKYHDYLGV